MKSLWSDKAVQSILKDPLALRVYTSQLLGQNSNLVMHGGGNTSVKILEKNMFGEENDILYIKGSGWDLETIQKAGFAPVKLKVLHQMAELKELSDAMMVKEQRAAMIDPNAPTPSVEAILHAIIPYKYVDHTHADSVVLVTNTPRGEKRVQEIYGDKVIVIPYVMPGFILAKTVYEMTRDLDWSKYEGMILLNHGIFTFHDDAKTSYENMIRLVTKAENYLKKKKAIVSYPKVAFKEDLITLAVIRQKISKIAGKTFMAQLNQEAVSVHFSSRSSAIAQRGLLTPDHVIRTKMIPAVLNRNVDKSLDQYLQDYQKYFNHHAKSETILDSAPRWIVWPGHGTVLLGTSVKDIKIVADITHHTMKSIEAAEKLGGWKPLPAKDIFEVEYWELEQAKLKLLPKPLALQGKIAFVTGAASGIGKACVESLRAQGAVVAALDINPQIKGLFKRGEILEIVCDVTDEKQLKAAVENTVRQFGGLDILVANAGIFPLSESIENLQQGTWEKSLKINLTSHQILLKLAIPFLKLGMDSSVIIMASKNVPAPGPGASAYSSAKAALTQLGRVAALELAPFGIRVNMIHPNQIFDTAIWTKEVLEKRAKHYKMSVEEYKKSNLLKVEITSNDVAQLVCAVAGPIFSKTTGSQIPIDGGNDRVI